MAASKRTSARFGVDHVAASATRRPRGSHHHRRRVRPGAARTVVHLARQEDGTAGPPGGRRRTGARRYGHGRPAARRTTRRVRRAYGRRRHRRGRCAAQPRGLRGVRPWPGRREPARGLGGQPDRGRPADPGRPAARQRPARPGRRRRGDPRGAGFAGGFLPLLLTSIVAGAALALAVASRAVRLIGLLAYGVLAGLVAAAVQHGMGVLEGNYLAAAGVDGLLVLAIASAVAGLTAVLGRAGVALGALLLFVLGNPISAVASAPQLLPQPWGAIGQLLPPGAGATLLRDVAFFDGAGATVPLIVLASWAVVGLVLVALRGPRQPTPAADPTREAARRLAAAA